MEIKTTTPTNISQVIIRLCKQLDSSQQPIYIPVKPWHESDIDDCFNNIERKVLVDGGQIQYGWTIWENPGVLVEGEFHAVWISPEEEIIDITQKKDNEQQILFLPVNNRVWEGELIDNVRIAISDTAYTRAFIKYSEGVFRLKKKYWCDGVSEIPFNELDQLEKMYGISSIKAGRNDPCPCGSGKKYKKCCLLLR